MFLTLYTALAAYLDDVIQNQTDIMGPQIRNVPTQFGQSLKCDDYDDPCICRFVQLIALETSKHYRLYVIGVIVKGSIDYLIWMVFEEQIGTSFLETAGCWLAFFRVKAGIGEVYAYFMFPEEILKEEEFLEFLSRQSSI